MKFLLTVMLLSSFGCAGLNAAAPLPCDEIKEIPGLKEEILAARYRDNVRRQLKLDPETQKLRDYALDASSVCHGNKKLR